jgi:nitrite reductase/ring-hydroxylating ferredoxin subunit
MPLRVRVCRTDEVAPGESRAFRVAGLTHPVLVTHLDGNFLATSSICPHEDVSLATGERHGQRIVCPGHGYEFDLRTGRCAHDPQLRLVCYPVHVSGDELFIELVPV